MPVRPPADRPARPVPVAPTAHRITAATCPDVVPVVDACGAPSLAARFLVAVPPPRAEVPARLARRHLLPDCLEYVVPPRDAR